MFFPAFRAKAFHSRLCLCLLLLLVSCGSLSARPARLRAITGNQSLEERVAASVDLDRDGYSELLVHGPKALFVYAHGDWLDRACTSQINFLDFISSPWNQEVLDITGDGVDEILVPLFDGANSFVRAYSAAGDLIWSSESIPEYNKESERAISAITTCGLFSAGGKRLLLCKTNTGFTGRPRSVFVFDVATGRQAWSVPFASIPGTVSVHDIMGDGGVPQILVGTYAPDNGATARGSADSTSSVCLIDAEGNIIWEHVVGGKFSGAIAQLEDMDGDGSPEIYVLRHAGSSSGRPSEVQLRDATTGDIITARSFPDRAITCWTFVDLDGDGAKEALIALSSGDVIALDNNLETRRRVPVSSSTLLSLDVTDLEGDGSPEIICKSAGAMIVLNNELATVARGECRGDLLLKGEGAGRHSIWLAPQGGFISKVEILPVPPTARAIYAVGAVLLAAVLSAPVYLRKRWLRARETQRNALWEKLLLEMREFWHGEASRNSLAELERAIREKMSHAGPGPGAGRAESLRSAAREFLRVSADSAVEVLKLARWLGTGGQGANPAFRDPSGAVARIRTLSEAGPSDEPLSESLGAIHGIQTAMSEITRSLRGHFSADVVDEVAKAVCKVFGAQGAECGERDLHPHAGAECEVRADIPGRPLVFARPGDLETVMIHLLENAKTAMEGRRGRLEIEASTDPIHTRIVVRDNGCGIPRDDWERVFQDGVSTKTGDHGHGLALCRERISKFHATLKVGESVEGRGSSFEIRLETVPSEKKPSA